MKTFEEIAGELDERGTPGRWVCFANCPKDPETAWSVDTLGRDEDDCVTDDVFFADDARLIAFLRNTLPEVLAVVRAASEPIPGENEELGFALEALDAKARELEGK